MQIQGGTEVAYRTVLAYRQYAGLEPDSNFSDALFSLHCDLIELAKEYGAELGQAGEAV